MATTSMSQRGSRDWRLDEVAIGDLAIDRQRVSQAVLNLARNAVDHTSDGAEIADQAVAAVPARKSHRLTIDAALQRNLEELVRARAHTLGPDMSGRWPPPLRYVRRVGTSPDTGALLPANGAPTVTCLVNTIK